MAAILERAQNEPIAVPGILITIVMFVNDLLTQVDGQTWWAALPIAIALVSRYFVVGPQTAARQVADSVYGTSHDDAVDTGMEGA